MFFLPSQTDAAASSALSSETKPMDDSTDRTSSALLQAHLGNPKSQLVFLLAVGIVFQYLRVHFKNEIDKEYPFDFFCFYQSRVEMSATRTIHSLP